MKTLEQLRADLNEAIGALDEFEKGIVDDNGEPRDMTQEEADQHEKLINALEKAGKAVEAKERSDRARAPHAAPADGKKGGLPAQVKDDKPFKSFGEFLGCVVEAGLSNGVQRDPRLIWQKASGANEAVPSEGGFLVQTDFSTELMGMMHDMGELLRRVRTIPISASANGIKLPAINETSRVAGSRWGGIRGYWADEADTVTATKPKFRSIELKLNKLMAIGYATEELLQDTTALEAVYKQGMAEEMTFMTEDAIMNGSGAGQPLGFMNAGALITATADSGQAAATITATNILNMMARLPARSVRNSVWLINQDILPQLWQLTIGSGTATHLMYAPPGLTNDNKNAPWGTLMGRPVIPTEYSATLGTTGDITLVDLSQYLMIDKGDAQAAESMHVRFLYDEMTFRITYRVDGQPAWNSAMTPFKGSNTQSPYIALATRS